MREHGEAHLQLCFILGSHVGMGNAVTCEHRAAKFWVGDVSGCRWHQRWSTVCSHRFRDRPDDAVHWRCRVACDGVPFDDLVGVASGVTGNPAILVYSTRMAPTEGPDVGYAMIFPSMTIVKVIAVQIVGLLLAGGAT
jgi:hypothetical protein